MNEYTLVGFGASAILLIALGFLLLRRQHAVRRMYMVMVLIGLGYLTATGAMDDVGRSILGASDLVTPAAETPAPAADPAPAAEPAPEPQAEPEPAPEAEAPPADNDNTAPDADAPAEEPAAVTP